MTDMPYAEQPPPPHAEQLVVADPTEALDAEARARYRSMQRLSHLLDNQFPVPGTDFRFGLDAIIGFIPGIGGAAGFAMAAGVIGQGILIGARGATVVRMLINALIDAALNTVPLLGYVSDLFFKANERNVKLLTTHAIDPDRTQAESKRVLVVTLIAMLAAVGVSLALALAVVVWIISLFT